MSSTVLEPSTQTTNSETQTKAITPKPHSNLDIALQAFIGKFIPSASTNASVEQILRGISHNAESFCKPQTKQLRMTPNRPTCAMSPIKAQRLHREIGERKC